MFDSVFCGISWVEWVGYVASALVLASLMMASLLRLRIINLLGATTFCIYGLLIGSYPVAGMNFLIILSNIYYLFRLREIREEFTIMEVSPNSTFLGRFLEINKKEIKKFFPKFVFDSEKHNLSFYILRNLSVSGLFIATHYDADTLKIALDYVTPEFRDFKVGNYIHHQLVKIFIAKGYRKLLCKTETPQHIKYLEKMGYTKSEVNEQLVYIKTLG